jgi:hypothetical protein
VIRTPCRSRETRAPMYCMVWAGPIFQRWRCGSETTIGGSPTIKKNSPVAGGPPWGLKRVVSSPCSPTFKPWGGQRAPGACPFFGRRAGCSAIGSVVPFPRRWLRRAQSSPGRSEWTRRSRSRRTPWPAALPARCLQLSNQPQERCWRQGKPGRRRLYRSCNSASRTTCLVGGRRDRPIRCWPPDHRSASSGVDGHPARGSPGAPAPRGPFRAATGKQRARLRRVPSATAAVE